MLGGQGIRIALMLQMISSATILWCKGALELPRNTFRHVVLQKFGTHLEEEPATSQWMRLYLNHARLSVLQ